MSTMISGNLLRDQFRTRPSNSGAPGRSTFRPAAFLQFLPAAAGATAVVVVKAYPQGGPSAVLTATSILTGFTFAMAMQMWKSSLDARRDERYAFDPIVLSTLDEMRTRLVWAVAVGVGSSVWLAGLWLFTVDQPARWALAIGTFLFVYQVTLVVDALRTFHAAAITLR